MKILKPFIWMIIVIAIIAAGVFVLNKGIDWQERRIAKLENELSELKEVVTPIRYKVTKRNGEMLTVAIKLYNLDGEQIGKTKKYELKGNTVSFDFYVAKLGNQYVAFPYKIFTDLIEPQNGTLIYNLYEENHFPKIYSGKENSAAFNKGIEALYKKIKSGDIEDIDYIFGNMVQNHPKADSSKYSDSMYKIVIHKSVGSIKIIEDN